MSDATIVAIMAGLPATIAAIGALIVSLRNGRKADDAKDKAQTAVVKANELAVGQEKIHELVNSNLSAVKNELAHARGEIAALRELVTALVAMRDGRAPEPRASSARAKDAVVETLDEVNETTKETLRIVKADDTKT